MHLFGEVWRHWGEGGQEVAERLAPRRAASHWAAAIREEGVGELHQFRHGSVEAEGFNVCLNASDRLMRRAADAEFCCGLIFAVRQRAGVRIARLLSVWIERQCPDATKEAHDAADAAPGPRTTLIPRPHEHQEESHRVCAVLCNERVGIFNVATRLAHALPVAAEDLPLIEEARERL